MRSSYPVIVFVLGLLIFVGAFFQGKQSYPVDTSLLNSDMQRTLAIQAALREGRNTYYYETNQMPGTPNTTTQQYAEDMKRQINTDFPEINFDFNRNQ